MLAEWNFQRPLVWLQPCDWGRLRRLGIAVTAVALIAASWRGVFDTSDNPRNWDNTEITAYVYAEVNPSINQWKPGDTLTICQSGSTTCILVAYANLVSTFAWAKARNIDSREKPIDASLWEGFLNWLKGQGKTSFGDMEMVTFLWDYDYVPEGTVTVGPLMPVGQGGTSLPCSSCHND